MSSVSKKPNHPRAPAKSTPFAAAVAVGNASTDGRQTTRSHQQRSAMTTSLRKLKRGMTVARKRHMKLANSFYSSPPTVGSSMTSADNPYSKYSGHVKDAIDVATSIVHVCAQDPTNEKSSSSLLSLLERMCVLLTPDDTDDISTPSTGKKWSGLSSGASYDSSMAGIAANSLLSQFVGEQTHQQHYDVNNNLAFLLANAQAHILQQKTGTAHTTTFRDVQIKATMVLNQLAATEPPPPLASAFDQDQFSPHGHPQSTSPSAMIASTPTSWCHVLVQSNALTALVELIPSVKSAYAASDIELYGKCVGVIGNLAGDSEMARRALQEMTALPRLIGCLSWGIYLAQNHNTNPFLVDLIRNCVWSLTNLFRDGGVPAAMFLDISNPHFSGIQGDTTPCLTLKDFSMLLTVPQIFPPSAVHGSRMDVATATWNDVFIEICWLLVFLTSDPIAVDFVCSENGQGGKNNVVSTIVSRLIQATDAASHQLNTTNSCPLEYMEYLVPCCRALKKMATVQDGHRAPSILLAEAYSTEDGIVRPAESALAKLISFSMLGGGNAASTIALEAVALTGACLCDAGLPLPHPATIACRTLVPALCQALVCQSTNFEFRREVACALLNAVEIPREAYGAQQNNFTSVTENSTSVQKEILAEIILTSPSEIAATLTFMLSVSDTEVLDTSLRLIDHLFRRVGNTIQLPKSIPVIFEEVGLVDSLWRICDNDSDESATAELAAEILDDFYEQEEEDEIDESLGPTSSGGQFQFQAPSTVPEGGFNFGATASLQHDQHVPPPMGRGRGRGRGKVLPSWMQSQKLM